MFFKEDYRSSCCGETNYWSFWRKMAIFVQTKNPNQCRIYQKKLSHEHGQPDAIISWLRTSIKDFQKKYDHYGDVLANL